ncbi:MAG: hypothetical protein ACERIH_11095 [Labilibaculum antarcticum]
MKTQNATVFKTNLVQLFVLFFLFGCASTTSISKGDVNSQKKTYQQIAEKKFGEKVEYKLNPNKTYALCQKMTLDLLQNPNQLIEFFIYDIQKEEIIYEDKIANAKISWHNNTQLLIIKQKGYIKNPTDTGRWTYIFDLKSKKKVTSKNTP